MNNKEASEKKCIPWRANAMSVSMVILGSTTMSSTVNRNDMLIACRWSTGAGVKAASRCGDSIAPMES